MQVREVGSDTLYRPMWALVEYRSQELGQSRLAVWRLGPDGEPRALYAPSPRWVRGFLKRALGEKEVEWFHPRVLARAEEGLVWWRPAWPAPMEFALPALKGLSGKSLPQPPLLFVRRGTSIHLFALPKDERPGPQTPLLLAPYPNYYPDRNWVCWGSGPIPPEELLDSPEAWESAFFGSAFTHMGGSVLKEGSLVDLWRRLARRKRFPVEALKPADLTVERAVARLLRG